MNSQNSESTYSYARQLHYGQGLSWSQVKFALLEEGITESQAKEMIANLEEEENEENEKREYDRILQEASMQQESERVLEEEMTDLDIALRKAGKKIKFGTFWLLGGSLLTVMTQDMVIWWGAVLYGTICIFSGAYDKEIIKKRNCLK